MGHLHTIVGHAQGNMQCFQEVTFCVLCCENIIAINSNLINNDEYTNDDDEQCDSDNDYDDNDGGGGGGWGGGDNDGNDH